MNKNPGGYVTLDFQGIDPNFNPNSPVTHEVALRAVESGKPIYVKGIFSTSIADSHSGFIVWTDINPDSSHTVKMELGTIEGESAIISVYRDNTFEVELI